MKNTCVLDSFVKVTGLKPEYLTAGLHKNAFERGFHTQEIIRSLVANDWAVTPIELYPVGRDLEGNLYPIIFAEENRQFFDKIVKLTAGVITGLNAKRQPHAVACLMGVVYDPADGKQYKYESFDFHPQCFWKVDKL